MLQNIYPINICASKAELDYPQLIIMSRRNISDFYIDFKKRSCASGNFIKENVDIAFLFNRVAKFEALKSVTADGVQT